MRRVVAVVAAAIVAFGCIHDDTNNPSAQISGECVTIYAATLNSKMGYSEENSTIKFTWDKGDQFSLYSSLNVGKPATFTLSDTEGTASGVIESVSEGDEICAVYPAREEINENPQKMLYSVGVQSQKGDMFDLSSSFMTAKTTYSGEGTLLTFKNQLALVSLNLTLPSGYEGTPKTLYLSSPQIYAKKYFDIATDSWDETSYPAHIQQIDLDGVSVSENALEVSAMIIPTTVTNIAIAIEMDNGKSYETYLVTDQTFEANNAYNWTISSELVEQAIPRYKKTFVMEAIGDYNDGTAYMRDPYVMTKDDTYYLTYTAGGDEVPIYTSSDMLNWTLLNDTYEMSNLSYYDDFVTDGIDESDFKVWAPEIHYLESISKWCMVHTTNQTRAMIALCDNASFAPNDTTFPQGITLGSQHDPSIFVENDDIWLTMRCADIIEFSNNELTTFVNETRDGDNKLSGTYTSLSVDSSTNDGYMGHEGTQIVKIGDRYVWFATAWSGEKGASQKGTYNLYYATSTSLGGNSGKYGDRRFAGRCLGHGTIFQDLKGNWWCTAFKNGTAVLPEDIAELVPADTEQSWSINENGFTLVPINVHIDEEDDVVITAMDPYYAVPGAEETQTEFYK